jgi:hypothetical protein
MCLKALGGEEVVVHLFGEQITTVLSEESLDTALRNELTTQSRRVK